MYKEIYLYPAVITKFAEDDYNVRFPDIEGINTFGETFEEAYLMAEDALKLYLFDAHENGEEIPESKNFFITLEENQTQVIIKTRLKEIIRELDDKAVKKTLTIPSWLNKEAENAHINFSQVLQSALKEHLNLSNS